MCRRIGRRIVELGVGGLGEYRTLLASDPRERRTLDGMCRVTISRFFRDRAVWLRLSDEIMPGAAQVAIHCDERVLRCWSAEDTVPRGSARAPPPWPARCVQPKEESEEETAVFAQVGPEPLKELLSRRHVTKNRNLFCSRYERCLNEALRNGWVSWTCAHCVRFTALRQHEAVAIVHPA